MHKTLTNINTQLTSLLKAPHVNSNPTHNRSPKTENPQMMELTTSSDHHHFKAIGRDLVIDIMSRLDALSLIAASATCTDLRDAAEDEILWKSLCHKTWPSTSKSRLSHDDQASFRRFFSDAFPLVSYDLKRSSAPERVSRRLEGNPSIPRGFASFVDIYYRGRCIFSKALDSLLTNNDMCGDSFYALRYYPFIVDLVGFEKESRDVLSIIAETNVPSGTCSRIDEEMRLSWIIYDETKGRAFNISSWKPRRASARNGDHTICFGCVVPVEEEDVSAVTDRALAEFVITVKFELVVEEEEMVVWWKQIELVAKDIDGTHFNVDRSMRVVDRAFSTVSRSISHRRFEAGYTTFVSKKMQLKTRADREETLANLVSATTAIATLVGICYACATLL